MCVCDGWSYSGVVSSVSNRIDWIIFLNNSVHRATSAACICLLLVGNSRLIIYYLILSRGSDSEGEWGEHHWEDLLASHSLDPEQVRSQSMYVLIEAGSPKSGLLHITDRHNLINENCLRNLHQQNTIWSNMVSPSSILRPERKPCVRY